MLHDYSNPHSTNSPFHYNLHRSFSSPSSISIESPIDYCQLLSSSPKSSPIYHFKILVPAAAAGRIIGKGGHTIAQLQRDAGARVKMSKPSEFYPGTTERVCQVSGPIDGILKINDFFLDSLSSTSIKILVPNSAAGIIIGKGGNSIKQIKEESGAYVQISQKCTDLSSSERCVTIIGVKESIRKACAMILGKIFDSTGSMSDDLSSSSLISFSGTPSPNTSITDINEAQIIESILLVLRVSGYGEKAIMEITEAMSVLSKYGVLGAGLGLL